MSQRSGRENSGTIELDPTSLSVGTALPPLPAERSDCFIDWRTLDPSTIQGEGIPLEQLLFYREKIEELLAVAPGKYVLIVGREIDGFFDGLEQAARRAAEHHGRRSVLVKKVVAVEPIHTFGGVAR